MRHFNGQGGHKRPNGHGTLTPIRSRSRQSHEIIGWLALFWAKDLSGRKIRYSKMIRKSEECPDIEAARKRLDEMMRAYQFQDAKTAILNLKSRLEGVKEEEKAYLDSIPALKIGDGFKAFLKTRLGMKSCPATQKSYAIQWHRFVIWLGKSHPNVTEMRHITRPICRQFSEFLLESRSASTHNRYLSLFKCMFRAIMKKEEEEGDELTSCGLMHSDDYIKKARLTINPWDCIEKAEAIPHSRRDLTIAEIQTILRNLKGEWLTLATILTFTGTRLHDAVLLTHEQVDTTQGFIRVSPHKIANRLALKGVKFITIPILPDLATHFSQIPEEKRHGYIMPELAALYLKSPSSFSYHLTKKIRGCGIVSDNIVSHGRKCAAIGAHHFRHAFVSIAYRYGIDLNAIRAWCGHFDITTTQKFYLHIHPDTIRKQMNAFPRLLSDHNIIDVPTDSQSINP